MDGKDISGMSYIESNCIIRHPLQFFKEENMAISEIKANSHEEWVANRKNYIGGSDAGAVVGLNPYSSRYALWAEKTGRTEGFKGNLTTTVGSYLEGLVADLFTDETGKKVRRKNATLVNDKYPWACADVDRMVVGEKAILEIKTTNSFPVMKKVRGGEFPLQWWCQICHYQAVTGADRAYLAVLINCRDLKIFTLERDEAEIKALMDAEEEFWELVKTDTPPEIDGSDATLDAINSQWPGSQDAEIYLAGFEDKLKTRKDLNAEKKALEAAIKKIDNEIKAEMQDAQRAACEGWKISWKEQNRSSFQRDDFEADHPDIDLDSYYKTTTSRVMRITEKGA